MKIPLLGDGSNYLPTIHVKDVAKAVRRLITEHYTQSYFLAVDLSQIS
jgi:NAD dependent epimerase/dehydratase family enzyme